MPRRTINDLLAFRAVAEARSFTRAAAQLGVSPSALSHTIRGLDERLGGVEYLYAACVLLSHTAHGVVTGNLPVPTWLRQAVDDLASYLFEHALTIRANRSRTAAWSATGSDKPRTRNATHDGSAPPVVRRGTYQPGPRGHVHPGRPR